MSGNSPPALASCPPWESGKYHWRLGYIVEVTFFCMVWFIFLHPPNAHRFTGSQPLHNNPAHVQYQSFWVLYHAPFRLVNLLSSDLFDLVASSVGVVGGAAQVCFLQTCREFIVSLVEFKVSLSWAFCGQNQVFKLGGYQLFLETRFQRQFG